MGGGGNWKITSLCRYCYIFNIFLRTKNKTHIVADDSRWYSLLISVFLCFLEMFRIYFYLNFERLSVCVRTKIAIVVYLYCFCRYGQSRVKTMHCNTKIQILQRSWSKRCCSPERRKKIYEKIVIKKSIRLKIVLFRRYSFLW